MTREEELAPVMHVAYLECARRLGWPIRPEIDVPFEAMSEDAKELDRAIARAVLAHLGEPREPDPTEQQRLVIHGDTPRADYAEQLRAQAAAHAEDVRKIQVRMVRLQQALRSLLAVHMGCVPEAGGCDYCRPARALLAETDGRTP